MNSGSEDKMLEDIIMNNKQMGTKQLINLARSLKIDISDIKQKGKYKNKLRRRILTHLKK